MLGAGSGVSVVRDDGTLLARFPSSEQPGSASMSAQRALNAGGILRETTPSDQVRRIVSAHKLANYPVTIAVSNQARGCASLRTGVRPRDCRREERMLSEPKIVGKRG